MQNKENKNKTKQNRKQIKATTKNKNALNKTKQRQTNKQTKRIDCMLQLLCITTPSVPVNCFHKQCFMHW